ncbi:MAG: hypothetical protein KA419_08720 [Acidobacteria bacterium]|nr:hypothetical protein [Acidobacteriota bacterium]
MPVIESLLSLVVWAVAMLGVAWPTERLLRALLPPAPARDRTPLFAFSAGLGLALLSTVVCFAAMLGALKTPVLHVLTAAVLAAGTGRLALILFGRAPNPLAGLGPYAAVALAAAASFLPFLSLPPVAWDALVYHLEVPRQYLLQGGMVELAGNNYAYFPTGTEMLFLLCLKFFPPFSTQVVHAGFLLLTLLALGETAASSGALSPRPRTPLALPLAAAVFLPSVWLNAAVPYIDITLMFYVTLAASGLYLFFKTCRRDHLLLGLAAGAFLPAVKYTGLFCLAVLAVGGAAAWRVRKGRLPLRWTDGVFFLGGCGLFAGPYLVRNLLWTGSPVFPFLAGALGSGSPWWTPEQQEVWRHFLANYGSFLGERLLYPLNYLVASVSPVLNEDRIFDGVLGPFLLFLPVLWLFRRRLGRANLFLALTALLYALVWGVFLRQMRFLFPVVPLILLLLAGTGRYAARKAVNRAVLSVLAVVSLTFSAAVIVPELRSPRSECKTVAYFSLDYLLGRQTTRDYLRRTLPEYRCQEFLNGLTPPPARVWVLFTGNKNFYLDAPYRADYVTEDYTFHQWLARSKTPADVTRRFRALGVTHLLTRVGGILDPGLYIDNPSRRDLALAFFLGECRILFEANGFAVLALK